MPCPTIAALAGLVMAAVLAVYVVWGVGKMVGL